MILKAIVDEQLLELNVPDAFIDQAQDFFAKMDADMDKGWQLNREWHERLTGLQRSQVAADKLLTALENEDHKLGRLMAGYILVKNPGIESVELSTNGEIQDHQLHFSQAAESLNAVFTPSTAGLPVGLDQNEAMAQAGKDVSQVFKTGKQYKFTVFNHGNQAWDESPAISNKADAEVLREQVFKARYDALCANH